MNIQQSKNLAMQKKAAGYIPGLTQLLSKNPTQFSFGVWPTYFERAKGAEVWDLDGNHYVDMSLGGIGATVLGYADHDVDAAVMGVIQKGISCSLNCHEDIELAELLCQLHPWAAKVRYTRSGGEAMAVAVRIARAFTGREKIAFCGYHGWHDWYLSANLAEEDALSGHLLPGLSPMGVPKSLRGTALTFMYNEIDQLKAILDENKSNFAAVVMEPIRNQEPKDGFLQEVRRLTTQAGAVLIVDEISAGFRLNCGGAHLILGLNPDMAVFAKAMGNGYPMAAVIGQDKVMNAAERSFISSTNWTERVGPTAALATIRKYRDNNVADHLNQIGGCVQAGWTALAEKHGLKIHVGGIKPLSHFVFDDENAMVMKAFFVQSMLEKGFLASTICYAMYAHTVRNVEDYLQAVDEVFCEMAELQRTKNLRQALKGEPAVSGFKRLA